MKLKSGNSQQWNLESCGWCHFRFPVAGSLAIVLGMAVNATAGAQNPPVPPAKKKPVDAAAVFTRLDKNADGKIVLEEFRGFAAIKNQKAADRTFKTIDGDSNGWLSKDEFVKWVKKMSGEK